MNQETENNISFIDAQNLHLGTQSEGWQVDFERFRIYLKEKYKVTEAYYFLGFLDENQQELYKNLQKAGFIVMFREHHANMIGKKKGNVDVDIVFEMMRKLVDEDDFEKIVLVSGDGDYIKPVKYLIEKKRLKKILFPNTKYSSLYKQIPKDYWVNLGISDVRKKIEYKKNRCSYVFLR